MLRQLEVPLEAHGQRLDVFLTNALAASRHQVQKLIRGERVHLNGEVPTVHRWLRSGDTITIVDQPPVVTTPPPVLHIIDETEDYLVLNKPSGVLVHPAAQSTAPVLTAALVVHLPGLVHIGAPGRPGIVHRLDRDVSGLLVVAKTEAMYNHLMDQFRVRRVKKRYTALVEGVVTKPDGVLSFPVARSKTNRGRMAARPVSQSGRAAETRYEVVRRFAHQTLLSLELVTGRTHQIRAHLKAFGHPIVGDPLYGPPRRSSSTIGLSRPFLEATTLGFADLLGHWREYVVPLDADLQAYLAIRS